MNEFTYTVLFTLVLIISCFVQPLTVAGQSGATNSAKDVYVDAQGIMRWPEDGKEVMGFGVNYTVPFAHAYRSAIKLGKDPLRAIDEDVYHFARLGFDLYRVHVWDTEISDTLGNLIFNEHLHAFDYLLKKLNERNINYVLTPIAFWGNGWPEPDEATPGFSAKYGKGDCLTKEEAIKAQENYLYQFLQHVNPYTGIAYKDDPRLIAIEVSNEPHHRGAPEEVTAFIQRMVEAIRETGCQKPVFYNISHSVHLAEDYFEADIQGGTFQWYPTGLGYQKELQQNVLPNVDHYKIPFDEVIKKNKGAKLVYEFDVPDVARSYPYPALARSFRKAGIQIATHFSYDPMFLAYANTEYNTHHMNLAYTPQKALSLMICSEVFHRVPMYKDHGTYPDNTNFEGFSVSYEKDLATINVDDKFYYTNHTSLIPKNISKLQRIAGWGSSPVVSYDGTGTYFLDKLEDGVWRLEVMPDAMIVSNPYGRNSLQKEVAVVQWNKRKMKIDLQDLGADFELRALNKGNEFKAKINNKQFLISPGAYLLTRKGVQHNWKAEDKMGSIQLNEFHAPENKVQKTYLVHEQPEISVAGEPLSLSAQVAAADTAIKVQVLIYGRGGGLIDMEHKGGFNYQATIPADRIKKGFFRYYLIVRSGEKMETFPASEEGFPYEWDFYQRNTYTVRVIDKTQPVYLFQAQYDRDNLSLTRWMRSLSLVPLDNVNESEFQVNVEKLFQPDSENLNREPIHDYTIKHYVNKRLTTLREHLSGKQKLVFKARALNDKPTPVQIALTMSDGSAYGKIIQLNPELEEHEILLNELKKVNIVTMPRPYPTFLPYYFSNEKKTDLDISQLEGIQISIGPGISKALLDQQHGIGVVSLCLE